MLDVQFGQASDFGKVRTNNEDAMGSFIPSSRQQGRSHGFLFVVADESAEWIWEKLPRPQLSRS